MEKIAKFSANLPKKYMKILKRIPESVYLVDEKVAVQIAAEVKKHKLNKSTTVLEINPGPRYLTTQLKRTLDFTNITCFEEDPALGEKLKDELKVNVVNANFLTFPRLHHQDKIDSGNRIAKFLDQVNIDEDEKRENRNLYVFGPFPSLWSINFLIKTLVSQRVLYEYEFKWQNPIFFISMGSKAYWILSSTPASGYFAYRASAILFQCFFNCQYLKELNRSSFRPLEKKQEKKYAKFLAKNNFNPEVMHLLKLEIKSETIETLGKEHLLPIWFFVRHHLFSRKRCVIAQLEQWIPGCGARLIRQGFTVHTQFGDLTPEKILDIYAQFISWPEFVSSSYLSAVQKYLARVDSLDEETFDFPK